VGQIPALPFHPPPTIHNMDAGASIIAFLSIGLQLVKVVYGFISAIKDSPSKLGDL
jgi:hypothetical protein